MHDDRLDPLDHEPTDELISNLREPVVCGMCDDPMPARWPPICDDCMERVEIAARAIKEARDEEQGGAR